MDVFLIPLGGDRYELYCEAPDETEPSQEPPTSGIIARIKYQFALVYAAAERSRHRRAAPPGEHDEEAPTGLVARAKARALAWIADAIAEQRLLWHLRHQTAVTLHFPQDMTGADAMRIARTALQRDGDRHRWWLAIDTVLMILSAALILVPGPNVVGYYFAFRVVGHFLAWRGAKQGLEVVEWQTMPSEPLAEVRSAIELLPPHRERTLLDLATKLRLDHLATFIERLVCQRTPSASASSS
jgi:hypothetical protein